MKVIYSGLEGSGKSLKLAMVAEKVVLRNSKWLKKSGIIRPIVSNLVFSDSFVSFAEKKGIPIIYWKTLEELISYEDCDIFIDEVGNYFDSRGWESLSLDVRSWLSQGSKSGIEIYGSAQDFAQVDKAFRRLVNDLYFITKITGSRRPSPTKPPVKRIWGLCLMREIEPMGYDEDKSKFKSKSIIPSFYFISKHACSIFDTRLKIVKSPPMPLKHVCRSCPDCGFAKVVHS